VGRCLGCLLAVGFMRGAARPATSVCNPRSPRPTCSPTKTAGCSEAPNSRARAALRGRHPRVTLARAAKCSTSTHPTWCALLIERHHPAPAEPRLQLHHSDLTHAHRTTELQDQHQHPHRRHTLVSRAARGYGQAKRSVGPSRRPVSRRHGRRPRSGFAMGLGARLDPATALVSPGELVGGEVDRCQSVACSRHQKRVVAWPCDVALSLGGELPRHGATGH
jgi:hypothetical protein